MNLIEIGSQVQLSAVKPQNSVVADPPQARMVPFWAETHQVILATIAPAP